MAGEPSAPTMRDMTLNRIFAAVLALDILGAIVALATGLADLGDAVVLVGTPLSAPFTFVAVQGLAVLAAARHRAGAAVLALLCVVSVMSGFFDGSFTSDELTAAHRGLQLALGIATFALGAAAFRTAVQPRRVQLA
jgi:hypothetical protein